MKNIIITALLVILVGCKDTNSQTLNNKIPKNATIENSIKKVEKPTCEEIINRIVKSSNLNTRNRKDFLTEIDRIEDDNIIIHVYIENNLSDNPKQKQIVESTIAWLSFNPNESKLFNTTADPDNPIELNFDKKILNEIDFFSTCQIEKKEKKQTSNATIKYSILPIDFDEYYSACVNPYDSIKCDKNYPRYSYSEDDDITKVFGKNYHPNNYMYLPKLNNYQPIILCNTDSDIESYDLIVVNDNKIISSLKIGLMDEGSITQFDITKDYIINLYKRKNTSQKNVKWKAYSINQNGKIIESI
jgi:hypothetical protein